MRSERSIPAIDPQVIAFMTRNEADMAFKKRVRTIFEWIEPTDHKLILDVPCGRGFYLNMIRYVSQCKLIGAEIEWDVILKARENVRALSGVALHNCSIYALPYKDETFDAVILSEVLEHLEDDVAGLKEAFRVLKPGGVAAITVPNANYPFWWDPINKTLERVFDTHIRHGTFAGIWANHVRLYERDQLSRAVRGAGFLLEEERAFTHHSFPFIHNLVYGLGKPLLESGVLPDRFAKAADRTAFAQHSGSLNPVKLGIRVLNFFDRHNLINEPAGRATVNLCAKARKPE